MEMVMTKTTAANKVAMMEKSLDEKKQLAADWFRSLRNDICAEFEKIESEYAESDSRSAKRERVAAASSEPERSERGGAVAGAERPPTFTKTPWVRAEGGGGEMSVMKGRVFEKVGVNISTVMGEFSEQFRKEIPGAAEDPRFWASGISLVAHMQSPLVPAAHFNTRMIVVGGGNNGTRSPKGEPERSERGGAVAGAERPPHEVPHRLWFGGGGDLNPMFPVEKDTAAFHAAFKEACDATDKHFYPAFKGWCDEYFFIPHRNESRGVGGIFYDYLGLNTLSLDHASRSAEAARAASGSKARGSGSKARGSGSGGETPPAPKALDLNQFGKGGVGKQETLKGMEIAANAKLDWEGAFAFTQAVGRAFLHAYPAIIRQHISEPWTDAEREHQLIKRGRYAEYNLLYDRGTKFGLMTGGNPEAILMSLPPMAKWE
jgi:coproporphyrinogen III oxidase